MARIATLLTGLTLLAAAPAGAAESYGIFDMTNVTHNIFVGQASSMSGAKACDFQDGGLDCSVIVSLTQLAGPYATCQQALDAFAAGSTPAQGSYGGSKVNFNGSQYWTDNQNAWCKPAPPPPTLTGGKISLTAVDPSIPGGQYSASPKVATGHSVTIQAAISPSPLPSRILGEISERFADGTEQVLRGGCFTTCTFNVADNGTSQRVFVGHLVGDEGTVLATSSPMTITWGSAGSSGGGSSGGGTTWGKGPGWVIGEVTFRVPTSGYLFDGRKFSFYVLATTDVAVAENVTAYIGRKSYFAGKGGGALKGGDVYSLAVNVPAGAYKAIRRAFYSGKKVVMRAWFTVEGPSGNTRKYIDITYKR